MWRGLVVALVALSQEFGEMSSQVSYASSVPKVLSLGGGATSSSGEKSTSAGPGTARTAWSLPSRARRRRGRRKAAVDTTRGRAAAPPAGGTARRASTTGRQLASVVGVLLLGGGTVSISPQVVGASPFDPRPPPKSSRRPFFEGFR